MNSIKQMKSRMHYMNPRMYYMNPRMYYSSSIKAYL